MIYLIQVPKFLWGGRLTEIGIHRLEPTEADLRDAVEVADRDGFERIYCYCDAHWFLQVQLYIQETYPVEAELRAVPCLARVADFLDKRWDSRRGRSYWDTCKEQRRSKLVMTDRERLALQLKKNGSVKKPSPHDRKY